MIYRKLGRELEVSAIGIGCMPMIQGGNIAYGQVDLGVAERTIHEAIDLGITLIDTAELYGPFQNEELVGRAVKGQRNGLVIATKFAMRWDGNRPTGIDGSPENARRACEGSLKRLGIDTIDLFYLHRIDPTVPIEETIGGMADLVKEGKVRYIGISEAAPDTIRRAAKTHPIAALQTEYSIWERDVEEEILPVCRENGIGFVPYSPLGRGFLTGSIRSKADLDPTDWRHNDPRYSDENMPKNLQIVEAITAVAKKYSTSNAQVALAWLLAQGKNIVPIPGVKRLETLRDSACSPDLALSKEDLVALSAVAPVGTAAGARYSEAGMATVKK